MKGKRALLIAMAAILSTSAAASAFAQADQSPDQSGQSEQAPTPPLPQQAAPPPAAPQAAPTPPPPNPAEPPPPAYAPEQLDQMVSPIALYPDPLLAQLFAAATYPDQIPDASQWADQHNYLTGQALADAIQAAQLPWDPSVQALLPFPSVLHMMAADMPWTTAIGDAFMAQQQDVMDAVQHERAEAYRYGYLRTNAQVVVSDGPYITIAPVNPGFVVVPYYNPAVVFFAPRPGFFVGGAVRFGFGISVGVAFRPWGWGVVGYNRFDWGGHRVFINSAPWGRTWRNRTVYVHPYPGVRRYGPARGFAGPHPRPVGHPQADHQRQPGRTAGPQRQAPRQEERQHQAQGKQEQHKSDKQHDDHDHK